MKVIAIITIVLLMNCKVSKGINQEDCEISKYCIVNIHIADSLYENSEPFTVIKELKNPLNGTMTDFEGNATLKMIRPINDSLAFVIGLMGSNGGDTIYIPTKNCVKEYSLDYYLPKWYREMYNTIPIKTPNYNQDINYGNKKE